jgi:plasmid stabilization system protein ParE
MNTTNGALLTRSEIWSASLKEVLQDQLEAQGWVNWLSEFPDGTTFTIPSIGEGTVRDYTEDTDIVFDALDTGEFQFTITEYLSSGIYITEKARQDLYYAAQLESKFVPTQARAFGEKLETDILALAAGGASGGQTASATNSINGAEHRFIGTGTNETFAVADAAKALFALKKANVPSSNLIAIVDPSVEYELNTLTNIVNMSNNPRWEGIIETGIGSDMRFIKNIFGFDFYVSNYLPTANETITLTTAAGKANIFFSASSPDLLPFMGAMRQAPKVDGQYNMNKQREEYVTTARYGLKVYRPENLVCVLTDTDQV